MPDRPKYLYERLDGVQSMGMLDIATPGFVVQNLNTRFALRDYQHNAFGRFMHCYQNSYEGKTQPLHLLFNMATGSGKTLIMAGLILFLYEQGYRNFLFFVHSNTIIEKTKDNFLNPASVKYLFAPEIIINNTHVAVSSVENFVGANPDGINICFTTIQKLHSDLTNDRENSLTFEDFRNHKVVLIADEAHHMNARTKAQLEMLDSWENTVERVHKQNMANLLLEFTATHDYASNEMAGKYRDKVIIRYDLRQFRNDRFSKDVVILQSAFGQRERILQALILNQYKQDLAADNKIQLKPVILFKSQKSIQQSRELKAEFHEIVNTLSATDVDKIRSSHVAIVQAALRFYSTKQVSDQQLAIRLQNAFQPAYCLSVNDEKESERNQVLVNTLEDRHNRIRAIFAVQKLNEGWDVLNLFDIVRCYETRDASKGKPGNTTISEAQLIGRGARYFPFTTPDNDNRFQRKFDSDLTHELRVLEELHYHSVNDSRYINEIKQALVEEGMLDANRVTLDLFLRDSFKSSNTFKHGFVWQNKKQFKSNAKMTSLTSYGVHQTNYSYAVHSGHGTTRFALADSSTTTDTTASGTLTMAVADVDRNIVQTAIARNIFFRFSNLRQFFPSLSGIHEFIASPDFLGGLSVDFKKVAGISISRRDLLGAISGLLSALEHEISANVQEFEGSREFVSQPIREVFKDKTMQFDGSNPRLQHDVEFETFLSRKDWYAFNKLYGTSEEKDFLRLIDNEMPTLRQHYSDIYVFRNEGYITIYNFPDGQAFQPDFILLLRQKTGEMLIYQLFAEPKGAYLQAHDQWKAEFLRTIAAEYADKILEIVNSKYRLIGLPFYEKANENEFRREFKNSLDIP